MLGKIFRFGLMLGIPLVLLAVFIVKPLLSDGNNTLLSGEGIVVVEDSGLVITIDEAQRMVSYVSVAHQEFLAESPENLQEFLIAKMTQKVMANEALTLGLNASMADVEWDLEESKRSILATAVIEAKRLELTIPDTIEDLAREYYIAHEDDFILEDVIEVSHILLRVDANNDSEKKALAEQILDQIQSGELTFEEGAMQYSEEEATAQSGGILGRFGKGELVSEFEDVAFALKDKDDISDVVKTQFGYHIIKLLSDYRPGTVMSYEDAREAILANEEAKYIKLVLTQYAEDFQRNERKTVYIPAMEQLLESMQINMDLSGSTDQ